MKKSILIIIFYKTTLYKPIAQCSLLAMFNIEFVNKQPIGKFLTLGYRENDKNFALPKKGLSVINAFT